MVPFWNRGREEKEREKDFGRNVGIALAQGRSQGKAMTFPSKQELNSLGKAYFLQDDENVLALILKYKPELFPIFSRLNATSQIKKEKDRQLIELYLDDIILHEEMNLEDNEDPAELQFLKSIRYFGQFRILDAWEGYRGKLVTEEIERTFVETQPQKKRGIL